MLEAILFDNDGVLVNTEKKYFEATQEICRQEGAELTLDYHIETCLKSSVGSWHLVTESEDEILDLKRRRNELYSELLRRDSLHYPHVEDIIPELSGQYRLGVVSGSRRMHFDIIHEDSPYIHHFEFTITCDDVSNTKPDPEPYQKGLARMQLAPENCIVIEDSTRGLQAAKDAGLRCIVIENEFSKHQDLSAADLRLSSIIELPDALRQFH